MRYVLQVQQPTGWRKLEDMRDGERAFRLLRAAARAEPKLSFRLLEVIRRTDGAVQARELLRLTATMEPPPPQSALPPAPQQPTPLPSAPSEPVSHQLTAREPTTPEHTAITRAPEDLPAPPVSVVFARAWWVPPAQLYESVLDGDELWAMLGDHAEAPIRAWRDRWEAVGFTPELMVGGWQPDRQGLLGLPFLFAHGMHATAWCLCLLLVLLAAPWWWLGEGAVVATVFLAAYTGMALLTGAVARGLLLRQLLLRVLLVHEIEPSPAARASILARSARVRWAAGWRDALLALGGSAAVLAAPWWGPLIAALAPPLAI